MDEDHVNGIEHLLSRCIVKRIFVPFLSLDCKLLIASKRMRGFSRSFIIDASAVVKRISPETEVIYIREAEIGETESEIYVEGQINTPAADISDVSDGSTIPSGVAIILSKKMDWMIAPYNIADRKARSKFYVELKNRGINLNRFTPNGLANLISDSNFRKIVKEAYVAVGNINTNSMVVYSGTQAADPLKRASLYLGDYNAKDNWLKLENCFYPYFANIGVITIPHHGSQNSFHSDIALKRCEKIISATTYVPPFTGCHPHRNVIKVLETNIFNGKYRICSKHYGRKYYFKKGVPPKNLAIYFP